MKILALIDGEHHPAVTRDSLDRLSAEHDLAGVLFVGGEEKLGAETLADPARSWGRDVSIPVGSPAQALRELAPASGAEAVIDLSGAPILDAPARFRLASVALHCGLAYEAAGMVLTPPKTERLDFDGPVIEVIGTGKRTGKTALAGHYASLLRDRGLEPVVVAMGRGGPAEPQLVRAEDRPDLETLREIVAAGGHAASDYLEDAVLAGVTCVGCRRCGEGPAGETFDSNVIEGAKLAASLDPDVVLLEGSGAALPPVEADRSVCVTNAARADVEALSYLGPVRLLRSDLVVIVDANRISAHELKELKRSLGDWNEAATLVGCRLEPAPAEPVQSGARVAFFTTAQPDHASEQGEALGRQGLDVAVLSTNLARRAELRKDIDAAEREGCDLYLTELKAAAVELVADEAARRGAQLMFVRNTPVSLPGEPDLDDALVALVGRAREGAVERATAVRPR